MISSETIQSYAHEILKEFNIEEENTSISPELLKASSEAFIKEPHLMGFVSILSSRLEAEGCGLTGSMLVIMFHIIRLYERQESSNSLEKLFKEK